MGSKYLIIKASSLEAAKIRLKELMESLAYPDHSYMYIVGDVNTGYANNTVIKNNTRLTDWGNGNYCFEFDENIDTEHGEIIQTQADRYSDTLYGDAEFVKKYLPKGVN
jgi:hypothetical protein